MEAAPERPHSWVRRLAPHLVVVLVLFAAAWQLVDGIRDVESAIGPFALWTLGLSTALGAGYLAWSTVTDRPELLLCCVLAVACANVVALPRLWSLTDDEALPFPGTFVGISLTTLLLHWIIGTTVLLPLHALIAGTVKALTGQAHWGEATLGALVLGVVTAVTAFAVSAVELGVSPARSIYLLIETVVGFSDAGRKARLGLWVSAAAIAASAVLFIAWFRLPPQERASVRKLPIGYYLPADKQPPQTAQDP